MIKNIFYILLFFCFPVILSAQNSGWNNIGGNWQKNGYIDVAGPTTDSILWETTSSGLFGAPLYIEGNYLVTMRFQSLNDAPVECFDLTTGSLLWSLDVTNNTGRSLPVGLRDGLVYVVRYTESLNDSLYALNVSDGSHQWTSNVNVASYISESGVFDSTGFFYIYGNLKTYKINPVNGQMIWQTTTIPMASGSAEMAISQVNNTGYTLETVGGISYLWAIDLSNGQKKYSQIVPDLQPGGNVPQSALMVGNNGLIYVQLTQDNVAALSDNGSQLNLLWQTKIYGNSAFSTMCVGADGSVYAPSNGKIMRFDPLSGVILDSTSAITQGGFFSPRISAAQNNIIYATNGENGVYAFDLSLNLIWSDVLNLNNTSGVSITPAGLAVVSGGNKVRVYKASVNTDVPEIMEASLNIYPNPATSYFTVESSCTDQSCTFKLSDAYGKEIKSGILSDRTIIQTDDLVPGLYLITVSGSTKIYKVVKF